MKRIRWIFWLLCVASSTAQGQMVVTDPALTSLASHQLGRLTQIQLDVAKTERWMAQWLAYEGDPKEAARRIEELSSYVTNVGRMGAPKYRADVRAAAVKPAEAMNKSPNPFRTEVGNTLESRGKSYRRQEELYANHLRMEAAVANGRDLLEVNRQHQHALLGYLSTANDHLESARTVTQLLAAEAEIHRIRTLMTGAAEVSQNLATDLALKEQERMLAREDQETRRREETWTRIQAVREASDRVRRTWQDTKESRHRVGAETGRGEARR